MSLFYRKKITDLKNWTKTIEQRDKERTKGQLNNL